MEEMTNGMEAEQNLSEGYTICVEVLPDGFRVSEPMPLMGYDDTQEDNSESPTQPDIASALKQVMAVVQANPVGQSEQAAFSESDAASV